MINISKLYCDQITPGDWIRYGQRGSSERQSDIVPEQASVRRPIVVWNITRMCNLKCIHCYNDSGTGKATNELSTKEAKTVLDDLSNFGVPSVLFSGGEPLLRTDLFELLEYAAEKKLRTVISTNGTLITDELCDYFTKYADKFLFSISLDGSSDQIHDSIRGRKGAFEATTNAIKGLPSRGSKVRAGLTFSDNNVFDFENTILLAKDLGCMSLAFGPALPFGRAAALPDIMSEQDLRRNEYIMKTAQKYK